MKPRTIQALHDEMAAVERGDIAPGRVWSVRMRADGTVERRRLDAKGYQDERKAAAIETENITLSARRKLGVSQDRFARMMGISSGTVRNWEQGRRKPSRAAALLLRVALKNPEAILAAARE